MKIITHPNVIRAFNFAKAAHGSINQKRKYTGEDYIWHPVGCAKILIKHVKDVAIEDVMAMLLHDTVEDVNGEVRPDLRIYSEDVHEEFGFQVGHRVDGLTDVSKLSDGNRAIRKEIDRQHTLVQPFYVKNCKLADVYHNHFSMLRQCGSFELKWMKEKAALVNDPRMDVCDPHFLAFVRNAVNNAIVTISSHLDRSRTQA